MYLLCKVTENFSFLSAYKNVNTHAYELHYSFFFQHLALQNSGMLGLQVIFENYFNSSKSHTNTMLTQLKNELE